MNRLAIHRTVRPWLALAFAAIASCQEHPTTEPDPAIVHSVRSIDLALANPTIGVGDTARVSYVLKDSTHALGATLPLVWSSSNPSAVTVDGTGLVRGVGQGGAVISATVNGVRGSIDVTALPAISSFAVAPAVIPLGSDPVLRPIFKDAAGRELVYLAVLSIPDTSLMKLTCSPCGPAKTFTKGMGDVRVVASVNGRTFQTTVRVVEPAVDTVVPNLTSVVLAAATSRRLDAKVIASGRLLDYPLSWASSDPSLVSIDSAARITWHRAGDATVTATAGGHRATIAVRALTNAPPRFASVWAGATRTCALSSAGAAWCWGDVSGSAYGEGAGLEIVNGKGASQVIGRTPGDNAHISTSPVPVVGGRRFTALASGPSVSQTCGIVDGDAYCWRNDLAPQLVSGGVKFQSLTSGTGFVCGLTAAGDALCWGNNEHGQLGNGTTVASPTPIAVATTTKFVSIVAGETSVCGASTSGAGYCWGAFADGRPIYLTPTPLLDTTVHFRQLTIGAWPCGIATDDSVHCWGPAASDNELRPTRLATPGFKSIGSFDFLLCGVLTTGRAACRAWDDGSIVTVQRDSDPSFVAFSGGGAACGVTADGYVYCWGDNTFGEAGELPVNLSYQGILFGLVLPYTYVRGISSPVKVVGQP